MSSFRYLAIICPLLTSSVAHHIDLYAANITSTDTFDPKNFWGYVTTFCQPDLDILSSCPPSGTSPKARNPAAMLFAQCFEDVFKAYFECSDLGDHSDQNPIKEDIVPMDVWEDAGNCEYLQPLPALTDACTFDANEFQKSGCCKNGAGSGSCSQEALNLLICELQAAEQYVRCTNAESSKNPPANTTACITDTAEKATWLQKDFLVFSGAPTCPKAHKLLTTLAISNVIAFLSALLSNTHLWKTLFSKSKDFSYNEIKLNFLSMFISIGVHVSIPFIMGVILEKQGYTINWIQQVFIWTVRPRAAPVIAILGLFHASWMEIAINEMVADLLFSIPAVNFAVFAAFFPNKTKNPMKPAIYKLFHAGGIMMLIPGVILTLALFAGFCLRCAPIRAFKYPAQDLWRLISNPIRKLRKKPELEKKTVDVMAFKGWFWQFFILGIVLYIGSWLVWASFLNMAGDLYCPASLNKIAAVLFLYPVILNAVRAGVGML